MGEARAKAAGEMGGPTRFGRKDGVSGAAPKGRAVPENDWGKGASKGVEAVAEGERNGEGWLGVAIGHCWGARKEEGGRVGSGCPKAAATLNEEDTGSSAGGKSKMGKKKEREEKKLKVSCAARFGITCFLRNTGIFNLMKVTTQD